MKIIAIILLLLTQATLAHSWVIPNFPKEPSPIEVLRSNNLADANQEALLRYLTANQSSLGYWLPFLTGAEQAKISSEYVRCLGSRDGRAPEYWKSAIEKLQKTRATDTRRIVDAVVRELGREGDAEAIAHLLYLADRAERPWVAWKSLASVQEILPRVDPSKLHYRVLRNMRINTLAPLLRDLDSDVASLWAWTLWEHRKKWLMVSFRSRVPLRTRIWLARAFATNHPQVAVEVFREGLRSHDPAIRTATEMFIRTGLGGSIPSSATANELLSRITKDAWKAETPIWEALPVPVEQPLIQEVGAGRTDLIWVSGDAKVIKTIEDTWPLIREPLPNGLCYSRVGDFNPQEYALTNRDGLIYARFSKIRAIRPMIAFHGGFWTLTKSSHATEFFPDGSILWECPASRSGSTYRHIAPISRGRTILLGYTFMECRDRRGDILWHTKLKDFNDPRYLYPISDDQFLVCCTNSVGLTTSEGLYEPIISNLRSTSKIRYHPDSPWIVFDGGAQTAILYDPKKREKIGEIDLNDQSRKAKSRFILPPGHFPE